MVADISAWPRAHFDRRSNLQLWQKQTQGQWRPSAFKSASASMAVTPKVPYKLFLLGESSATSPTQPCSICTFNYGSSSVPVT